MRVALTVWEGRISPVFDTARSLLIVDIEDGRPVARHDEQLSAHTAHETMTRLRALGVEVLICGAVSRPLAEMIRACGIRLLPFVSGERDEVVAALIAGRIPDIAFAMPGCGGGRGRRMRARRGACGEALPGCGHGLKSEKEK
jgi:predicted Fe-Mo cluster-binding NifX family protein